MSPSGDEVDPFADQRPMWDFFQTALLAASNDLRQILNVDETGYLRVSGYSHADPRSFLLYGVLDDVQKAGVAMAQWVELLGPDQDLSALGSVGQLDRVILGAVLDDQSLRMRKLVEALATLINFERTNEADYYRHYLLLADLDRQLSAQLDRADFFGARSRNIDKSIEWTQEHIAELMTGAIDADRCWYSANGGTPGRIFRSTRTLLKEALKICTEAERVALGFSYGSFSVLSSDVHFSPGAQDPLPAWSLMAERIGRVGVLGLVTVVRCQMLVGATPEGINARLRDAFDRNEFIPAHIQRVTVGLVEVGDFVVASGDLAEVVEVSTSWTGYRSYHVSYLAERPLPGVDDDWFPAFAVRRLYGISDWFDEMSRYVREGRMDQEELDYLANLPDDAKQNALRHSLVTLWPAGLREAIFEPRTARPTDTQ